MLYKEDDVKRQRNTVFFSLLNSLIFLVVLVSIFIAWSDFWAFRSREIKACSSFERDALSIETLFITSLIYA